MNRSQASSMYHSRSIEALRLQVNPIAYGFWQFAGTTIKEAREKNRVWPRT
jgi:hypothetical protein